MLIRQLEYFVTLAREHHFARAAEACGVSQPALSAAIRKLEEDLGVALVQRGQRYSGLTPDGERLLPRAQRVLAECAVLRQDAASASTTLAGQLRLGAIPTTMPVVPLLTAPFQEQWPQTTMLVRSRSGEQIVRELDTFELDIGFTYIEDDLLAGFRRFPLYRERYALLMRDPREVGHRESIGWQEVASLPLCLLTPEMHNRRMIDATFRDAGVEPRVAVETDTIFAVYSQVRCSGLYSVVPHSMLSLFELRQEVHAIPIVPELVRPIGLVVRADDPLPPLVDTALRAMAAIDLQARFDSLIKAIY